MGGNATFSLAKIVEFTLEKLNSPPKMNFFVEKW
jgi:hypothetical protein